MFAINQCLPGQPQSAQLQLLKTFRLHGSSGPRDLILTKQPALLQVQDRFYWIYCSDTEK